MSKRPLTVFSLLALLAAAGNAPAQPAPPDDATITALMVGTWVNPRESPDFTDEPAKETFRADGTYTFYQYSDRACTRLSTATTARWYVKEAVLVSVLQDGTEIKDTVLAIEPPRLMLRSFETGQTYYRRKSNLCPTATQQSLAPVPVPEPVDQAVTATSRTTARTIP